MLSSHSFLGIRVDNVTMDQTIERVSKAVTDKSGFNIVTVNPELVMIATKNSTFKEIIKTADIVTPDGIGLLIMGQLTGRKLRERVTGVDLCDHLAQEAAKQGWSIYLLGAPEGVAQQAARNLQVKYPGLIVAGANSSDPDDKYFDAIQTDIAQSKPDILLVAYGSPAQELWIKKHRQQLGKLVTVGIGGSFDFIAGSAKRAPKFVQRFGLEWLWRLILQPKRWKRMLALPKFAILCLFK